MHATTRGVFRAPARLAMLAAAVCMFATVPVQAQTPLTSGDFNLFSFAGVGSSASGQPFTFSSAMSFYITVVDGAATGDQFQLSNGLTPLGTSPRC